MALIESPPPLSLQGLDFERLMDWGGRPDIQQLLHKVRDEYLPWDKFRWLPLPEGVGREELWSRIRLERLASSRPIPLLDKSGQPFRYGLPDCVLKLLSHLDRNSGDLIGNTQGGALPSGERYVISSLMEEAIASSQLEGASTTRVVAKKMLLSGRAPRDPHEKMIVNNWRAMEFLREQVATRPRRLLSPEFLCEIQATATRGTLNNEEDAGRLRLGDDVRVVDVRTDDILHDPPLAADLPARMQALCDFANHDDERSWVHPVAKAVILHFWIGYDHPFVDGNGRTARALFYWYLLSRGYWLFEYLSISRLLREAPIKYSRAYLYTETDSNDLTYFIVYNLRVVEEALRGMREYLARKQRELSSASALTSAPGMEVLNERQRALVAHASRHPEAEYTAASHQNLHGVANETARADLLALEKSGFLHRAKRGRAFVFRPATDLHQKLSKPPER